MKILISLIAFFFVANLTYGQQVDKNDQILKQLIEISKTLNAMKQDTDSRMKKTEADILQLRSEISALSQIVSSKTSSSSPTLPPTVPLKVPSEATVIVENNWQGTVRMLLNDKWYDIPTNTQKTIHVWPGRFTYQCLTNPDHVLQERYLTSGETLRLVLPSE